MIQFMKVCRTAVSEPRVIATSFIAYFDYQHDGKVHLHTKDGDVWHIDQNQTTIEAMLTALASGVTLVDYRNFLQS